MNRMKTAFKSLRDYLGRDVKGIELLQRAESAADELRKENARLRQSVEDASRIASEQKVSRLESDKQLLQELSMRQAIEARLAQSEVTVKRLMSQLQPPPPPDAREPLTDEIAISRQIKTLKYSGFKWPAMYSINEVQNPELKMPTTCYDLVDIIKNWSGEELMKLGRFVALEATGTSQMVVIYSSQRNTAKSDSTLRQLLGMLENVMTTVDDDEAESEFVGSKAQPPKLRLIERDE